MSELEEIIGNLTQELRRGSLILAVLSQLRTQQYGYSLVQLLCEQGMPIDAGTLYPLLRRLEKQGMLESSWEVTDARPRRYYCLSTTGREVYEALKNEWRQIDGGLQALMQEEENGHGTD